MFGFSLVGISSAFIPAFIPAFPLASVSNLGGASWVSICGSGSALGTTVLYMEDYFSKAVDNFGTILGLISIGLSDVARNVSLSYTVVMLGGTVLMVNIKVYLCCSMIVGNFVDVYPFGILAVLMN